MKHPNFFVVGAPKCGTTALCQYLSEHPNVFISAFKEPHYFAEEFNATRFDTWEKYVELFEPASPQHRWVGEGSTHYLYSPTALKNIYRYNPDARIVVMVRNPVELAYSYHSQLLFNLHEDEADFEKAWQLQAKRAKGEAIPAAQSTPMVLQYKSLASTGAQIERLLSIFPHEQVHLILFDDFRTDTAETYQKLLSFLALPDDGRTTFETVNASRTHRFRWLSQLTETPPPVVMKTVKAAKRFLGVKSLGLNNALRQVNQQPYQRQPLTQSFKQQLFSEFRADVDRLSTLFQRDLSVWEP